MHKKKHGTHAQKRPANGIGLRMTLSLGGVATLLVLILFLESTTSTRWSILGRIKSARCSSPRPLPAPLRAILQASP